MNIRRSIACYSLTAFDRAATAAAAVLALAALPAHGQHYSFDEDNQGWAIYNVGLSGNFAALGPTTAAPWIATGGLQDGCLRVGDIAGETCIGAPAAVKGNRSSLYDHFLSYDAFFRACDNASYSAVVIAGPTFSIFYPHPKPTLNQWEHHAIQLNEAGWHVGSDTGTLATADQFKAVLADVRGVFIRTEWNTGPDDTSIDNVVIGPACPADINHDDSVDLSDFFDWFNYWDTSDTRADVDGVEGLDLGDYFFFLGHFDTSC